MLIRRMVAQLALPVEIVAHDTVREPDGLALSSRNGYLSAPERAEAPTLNRSLVTLVEAVRAARTGGTLDPARLATLEQAASEALRQRGWQPDYVAVRRRRDLQAADATELGGDEPLVALAAARLGKPRLIDNVEI
jgi:pantoate--beta-alanine ligase